jgi:S-adenosylmethionine:tRNA ribosyltransferase-isomerase
MRASDFDFQLPPDRIAQAPLPRRDDARLYVLDRAAPPGAAAADHRYVRDLPSLLPPRALLVLNDTRVIPARLHGRKPTGGRVELLLCEPLPGATPTWRCLGGASKPIRVGPLTLDGGLAAEVLAVTGEYVDVRFAASGAAFDAWLAAHGEVPLPPYIRRDQHADPRSADDRDRYQTVFASAPGAVAAPTAGLHFTQELLTAVGALGIECATLTLHVGPGTFAPLRSDELDGLRLHHERYEIPDATAAAVDAARAAGRPVVAVGTTVVRTLEAAAARDGHIRAGAGSTDIFIRPGHRFRIVDMMLTNFHLPKSSLIVLVAAFAGQERILAAYADAVARGYRFYSYGDAMLIK